MLTRQDKGKASEELAEAFLVKNGMEVLTRNFRCPIGEIDLVGRHERTIVFVEVRARYASSHGSPQESITYTKRRRLTRLAHWYLKRYRLERHSARFDVVAITWRAGEPEITWIANAFEACE